MNAHIIRRGLVTVLASTFLCAQAVLIAPADRSSCRTDWGDSLVSTSVGHGPCPMASMWFLEASDTAHYASTHHGTRVGYR